MVCQVKEPRAYIKGQCHICCLNVDNATIRVLAVILFCMERFLINLAHMFCISRRCVARKNHAPNAKVAIAT